MRVCQGGHDVPDEKLRARFERTLANLQRAIQKLPHVIVFSNEDLSSPYQLVAYYENGHATEQKEDESFG
jgi:predicted ABC-type ATPase